jgi:hypothetical protein
VLFRIYGSKKSRSEQESPRLLKLSSGAGIKLERRER